MSTELFAAVTAFSRSCQLQSCAAKKDVSAIMHPSPYAPQFTELSIAFEVVKPDSPRKTRNALITDLCQGVSETRFWDLFVQCLLCKAVVVREGFFSSHKCCIDHANPSQTRHHPYRVVSGRQRIDPQLEVFPGDLPQSSPLRSLRPSPAPTEIVPESIVEGGSAGLREEADYGEEDFQFADSDLSYEVPSPPSSGVLPSVMELIHGARRGNVLNTL